MWSLLEASRLTLTNMSVPTRLSGEYDSATKRFWLMRFPRLRSLFSQHWGTFKEPIPRRLPPDRTQFFLNHCATLDSITSSIGGNKVTLSFAKNDQHPSRLALRHLDVVGSVAALWFRNFNRSQMTSALESLSIQIRPHEHVGWLPSSSAVEAIFRSPGLLFPALRLYKWDFCCGRCGCVDKFKKKVSLKMFQDHIELCSRVFGSSLEVWRGLLPPIRDLDVKTLGTLLRRCFPKLVSVDLSRALVEQGNEATHYAEALGIECPSLMAVFVQDGDGLIRYDVNGGFGEPAILQRYANSYRLIFGA
jgi:hypothetical protein